MKKEYCKVCGEETIVGFNINLKRVPVCDSCAYSITRQQMDFLFAWVNTIAAETREKESK